MHIPTSASGQLAGDGGFGVDGEDVSGEHESGLKLWETKYRFQKEMLPSFVGEVFGRKVSDHKMLQELVTQLTIFLRSSQLGRV